MLVKNFDCNWLQLETKKQKCVFDFFVFEEKLVCKFRIWIFIIILVVFLCKSWLWLLVSAIWRRGWGRVSKGFCWYVHSINLTHYFIVKIKPLWCLSLDYLLLDVWCCTWKSNLYDACICIWITFLHLGLSSLLFLRYLPLRDTGLLRFSFLPRNFNFGVKS